MRAFCVLALAVACSSGLFGWGPEGHRIVATIAFKQLPKPIKDEINVILGDEDFVEVSNWADVVRLSRPDTKDWHFVDIPVSATKYDASRDCEELETGDCAINELSRATAVLRDRGQP